MDEQERLRIEKEYDIATDEDIRQMLLYDKDEYEEGVYELILEQAKKRGIDKADKPLDNRKGSKKWLPVYKFSTVSEAESLEAFLKKNGIPVDIVQDGCHSCSHTLSLIPETGVVRVREDFVDKAQELIANFKA
jgi:hypothetical protein